MKLSVSFSIKHFSSQWQSPHKLLQRLYLSSSTSKAKSWNLFRKACWHMKNNTNCYLLWMTCFRRILRKWNQNWNVQTSASNLWKRNSRNCMDSWDEIVYLIFRMLEMIASLKNNAENGQAIYFTIIQDKWLVPFLVHALSSKTKYRSTYPFSNLLHNYPPSMRCLTKQRLLTITQTTFHCVPSTYTSTTCCYYVQQLLFTRLHFTLSFTKSL